MGHDSSAREVRPLRWLKSSAEFAFFPPTIASFKFVAILISCACLLGVNWQYAGSPTAGSQRRTSHRYIYVLETYMSEILKMVAELKTPDKHIEPVDLVYRKMLET